MSFWEIELYGRKIRFYDETHIEMEFRNIEGNWRKKPLTMVNTGYLYINIYDDNKNHFIRIHRVVFFAHNPFWDFYDGSLDNYIDHIDRNKSNNKIENLRCVTHQENGYNREAKGYYKVGNKWCAYIRVNNKKKYLGIYDTPEEARNAYLEAKQKYHIINPKVFN